MCLEATTPQSRRLSQGPNLLSTPCRSTGKVVKLELLDFWTSPGGPKCGNLANGSSSLSRTWLLKFGWHPVNTALLTSKNFIFLVNFEEARGLHRKCSKDHSHIKIEGQWTKASAVYTDALADAIGEAFDAALQKKLRLDRYHDSSCARGLESPLINDVLISGAWEVCKSWAWKKPSHINIQETNVVCRLLKDLALESPKSRSVVILDSNVGFSSLVGAPPMDFVLVFGVLVLLQLWVLSILPIILVPLG